MNKTIFEEPSSQINYTHMINKYLKAAISPNGAILFGVIRGRTSEGIDFLDAAARAVIIVGVPFPNMLDVKVKLKKDYLNKKKYSKLY